MKLHSGRYAQGITYQGVSLASLQGFPNGNTIIIAAFAGWNDAAQSATDALEALLDIWDVQEVHELSADDYYDYTFNRPEISTTLDGQRLIEWPSTTVFRAKTDALPNSEIFLVLGVEPNLKWKTFCDEVLKSVPPAEGTVLITLGALLADVPHTRPIPVNGTSANTTLQELTGFEQSRYEGPTGILGILQSEAEIHGIPSMALWAAVPHYVAAPPCPKATLGLLRALEDVLDISLALEELVEDSIAWQTGVEEMANEDEEVAEYVRSLEETQDTADLPEASGEAIAREFERYLRRREK